MSDPPPIPGFAEAVRQGAAEEAELALSAALGQGRGAPRAAFAQLAQAWAQAGALDRAERWAREGLDRHPDDEALALLLAAALRAQRRPAEAAEALRGALARRPGSAALKLRLAQVQVARGEGAEALALLAGLPPDAEAHRARAGAHRALGDRAKAVEAIEAALQIGPRDPAVWLQRELLAEGDPAEALAVLDRALAAVPGHPQLRQRRIAVLVDAGRGEDAVRDLEAVLAAEPRAAWAWVQLGRLQRGADPAAAQAAFRKALALEPENLEARVALAHSLLTGRAGDLGAAYEEAAQLVLAALARLPMSASAVAADILWRTGFYAEAESFGGFSELGRYWAQNGAASAFLHQFAKVETDADRLELLEQHRIWAARLERAAAERPIARPPPGPRRKLRLGLLSADLRGHVVAYFVQPLFDHPDSRFEIFCYSTYPGPADDAERWIGGRVAAYRKLPSSDRAAAEAIAADGLDLLIELGGPTLHNRPGIMAFRPAPRQASWLGYPHSLGLSAIDHFVADPHLVPPKPELLAERPLLMPQTWVCMGPGAFPERHAVDPVPPSVRTGGVTFGTANNSYKWSPRLLRTWARVVADVPGSRFMFLRPEVGSPSLRANLARIFAEQGVDEERLEFRATAGGHMPMYNEVDVALDTFPLTGGTTTCEALWMGVPTISLVGDAVYERLSHSLLTSAGLSDLVAANVEGYVRTAVALARDPERLAEIRATARDRVRASPLGQPERFARDFYELMARTIG